MGVRILNGDGQGDSQGAVLYDSVSGWAFGPIFPEGYPEAQDFLEWIDEERLPDPRGMADLELERRVREWREARKVAT